MKKEVVKVLVTVSLAVAGFVVTTAAEAAVAGGVSTSYISPGVGTWRAIFTNWFLF